MSAHFTPAFFKFLRDLKAHNDRAWFQANRERYVADVEAPMLQFITDVGERLPDISPAYVANRRRVGGSMYRISRDTRFSADKSPYKTWVAATFKHRSFSKDVPTPGFYLHLGPKECFAGGGIYHPEMPTLTKIRQHRCRSEGLGRCSQVRHRDRGRHAGARAGGLRSEPPIHRGPPPQGLLRRRGVYRAGGDRR
jgi:uncharacterized protein (TIGR02453 family)